MIFQRGFALACLAVLTGFGMEAQITGDLRGTVTDASGAAVSRAKVTLTNMETRQERTETTGPSGEFAFELLGIGHYSVKAEAAGFAAQQAQTEVKTGEIAAVNFRLPVGPASAVVEVTSAVAQIDTENAQLQTSFTGQAVQEIPVTRDPNRFALSAPGVFPVSQNNPYLGTGSFNANGGRGRANNVMVDGITATDVSVTGTVLGPLNFSSIKEVKVITNNFSAEYGRNASSQVLYITKSGTNDLHGEVYEYFENNVLDARSFFDRTGQASILRQNTWGFEVGGPVIVPRLIHGRNRIFWHSDYEGLKKRGVGTAVIANVPTPAMMAQVMDPTSLALLKQYQVPTSPTGTLSEVAPNTTNTYEWAERGDFVLNPHDLMWMRYAVYNSSASTSGNTFLSSNLPYFGASSTNHPRQATFAETHTFGFTAVNEFRFGFGQSEPNFPIQTPYPLGPSLTFLDGSVTGLGVASNLPQGREQRTYEYTDNFSITKGTHTIKTGFEFYHLEADSFFDNNFRGSYTFANWAAFAAGEPSAYSQDFGNSVRDNRVQNAFAFAQDDWRIARNLTMNIGVRLEFSGGPTETENRLSNLYLNNSGSYGASGPGPLGLLETGHPSFNSTYNWAPRLGFAYQPFGDQKTVIRAGFGYAYDFIFLNPITNQRFLPPLIYTASLSGVGNFTGQNSWADFAAGTAALQQITEQQVGSFSPTALNFGAISPAIAVNLRDPMVQQRSFGVERQLANNLVLKATYVGTHGTYLTRTRPINLIANPPAPATSYADEIARLSQFTSAVAGLNGNATAYSNRYDPRYNAVNYVESSANSEFNALEVEVQKRFSERFFANLAYTWSHSIDDSSDVLGVLLNDTPAQQNPNDNHNNRGDSQFDLRHVLTVTHTWEMPFFVHSKNAAERLLLGGWAFAGISTYHSGPPTNVVAGATVGGMTDPLQYLGTGNNVDRPNASGPVTSFNPVPAGSAGAYTGTTAVNGVAISNYALSLGLSQPLVGNFGTLPRNYLRLNGQTDFDMDLYKNFHINEKVMFQLRGEFYNIFNLHAFQTTATSATALATITSTTFGQYTSVSLNSRLGQLAARIVF
ncbi:MAG TPA: carboxypeptidase regulatory-like domain-containing protein [Bryobacteraceae bacterium]|nr:carboxypeptidase regulatory-like domain-containing protein [Bryobacteraceae bacterium]